MHKRDFGTWVRCEICGERRIYNSIGERLVAECQHETQEPFETPMKFVPLEPARETLFRPDVHFVNQCIAAAFEQLANRYPGNHGFGEVVKILAQDLRR